MLLSVFSSIATPRIVFATAQSSPACFLNGLIGPRYGMSVSNYGHTRLTCAQARSNAPARSLRNVKPPPRRDAPPTRAWWRAAVRRYASPDHETVAPEPA